MLSETLILILELKYLRNFKEIEAIEHEDKENQENQGNQCKEEEPGLTKKKPGFNQRYKI